MWFAGGARGATPRFTAARRACIALLVCLPGPATAAGKTSFNGWLGVESESYGYTTPSVKRDTQRLSTTADLNGRGFIWDPRFATYDAGITLQRESRQTTDNNTDAAETNSTLLGYRLSTTWFANKPYALNLYANRSQSTVADYRTPSYALTSTTMGARWGWENQWAGRMRFYVDSMQAESSNSLVPRSDRNISFGVDSTKKVLPKQWGESDVSYGYRHNEWEERTYGTRQGQDYLYLNDHSKLGDKANLSASLTYYTQSFQLGGAGTGSTASTSNYLNFNSGLTVQESENLRHSYNLGLNMNESAGSQTLGQTATGALSYRFNSQWQANGSLGLSSTKSESAGQSQTSSTALGSGGVQYADKFGDYLVNGGYDLSFTRTDTTFANAVARQSIMQTVTASYTRPQTPIYADSLQLRLSQTLGEPKGSELNARYSATSTLSQKDALQGTIDYRRSDQTYAIISTTAGAPDAAGTLEYLSFNSKNTRLDLAWRHRFTDANALLLSVGANKGESSGLANNSRYAQASASALLLSNLQMTALARTEQIEGTENIAGKKLTLESNLSYRLGKWQANARFRLRDARMQVAPFKEQSIFFSLRRDYGFTL